MVHQAPLACGVFSGANFPRQTIGNYQFQKLNFLNILRNYFSCRVSNCMSHTEVLRLSSAVELNNLKLWGQTNLQSGNREHTVASLAWSRFLRIEILKNKTHTFRLHFRMINSACKSTSNSRLCKCREHPLASSKRVRWSSIRNPDTGFQMQRLPS